jgi:hypothetical protein
MFIAELRDGERQQDSARQQPVKQPDRQIPD